MSTTIYFITLGVMCGTPIAIFAMKYWSDAKQARARREGDEAYRKLADDAVTAQAGSAATLAATLAAIQSELAEIKTRMAAVEKVLKEV